VLCLLSRERRQRARELARWISICGNGYRTELSGPFLWMPWAYPIPPMNFPISKGLIPERPAANDANSEDRRRSRRRNDSTAGTGGRGRREDRRWWMWMQIADGRWPMVDSQQFFYCYPQFSICDILILYPPFALSNTRICAIMQAAFKINWIVWCRCESGVDSTRSANLRTLILYTFLGVAFLHCLAAN